MRPAHKAEQAAVGNVAASPKVKVKSAPDESPRTQAGKTPVIELDTPYGEPGVREPSTASSRTKPRESPVRLNRCG